jgi:uncharacterized phage infection (PIP) family protein YhgE
MKHSMILGLVAAALTLSACGESQEDKARSQVCDARADIKKQVDELSGLTLATATVDGVKANLEAIKGDLRKIKDAQGDLNAERKKQVTDANQEFKSQLSTIVKSLGENLSLAEAGTQIKAAATKLTDSYSQTLGQVDCA